MTDPQLACCYAGGFFSMVLVGSAWVRYANARDIAARLTGVDVQEVDVSIVPVVVMGSKFHWTEYEVVPSFWYPCAEGRQERGRVYIGGRCRYRKRADAEAFAASLKALSRGFLDPRSTRCYLVADVSPAHRAGTRGLLASGITVLLAFAAVFWWLGRMASL